MQEMQIGMPMRVDETALRLHALQMAMALYTNKEGVTTATKEQVLAAAVAFADFTIGPKPESNNVTAFKAVP